METKQNILIERMKLCEKELAIKSEIDALKNQIQAQNIISEELRNAQMFLQQDKNIYVG